MIDSNCTSKATDVQVINSDCDDEERVTHMSHKSGPCVSQAKPKKKEGKNVHSHGLPISSLIMCLIFWLTML